MANYCLKEMIEKCNWRFSGVVIGTERALCNCRSEYKPCQSDDEDLGNGFVGKAYEENSADVSDADFIYFFGKNRQTILDEIDNRVDVNISKQKLFKDASTCGRNNLHKLYTDTDFYKIPLANIDFNFFSNIKKRKELEDNLIISACIDNFPDSKDIKVLDYGSGCGGYSTYLSFLGYEVTLADLPTKMFKFMQYIHKKYKTGIKFFECQEEYEALNGDFDYIICSELLEHVDEPEQLLKHLISLLKEDGVLYLSTFFDDCNGNDPSHLKKNTERFNDSEKWMGKVLNMGITPVCNDSSGVPKVFRKIGYVESVFIEKCLEKKRGMKMTRTEEMREKAKAINLPHTSLGGWMPAGDVEWISGFLIDNFKSDDKLDVMELGVFQGGSSCIFLTLLDNCTFHAVDNFEGGPASPPWTSIEQGFDHFTEHFKDRVVKYKGDSIEIGKNWKIPLDICYVDGCHDYEYPEEDIKNFKPHVKVGGYMLVDDSDMSNVYKSIKSLLVDDPNWIDFRKLRNPSQTFEKISVFKRIA